MDDRGRLRPHRLGRRQAQCRRRLHKRLPLLPSMLPRQLQLLLLLVL